MTDFAAARRMMVDGQVRTSDVTDLRLQAAMLELPREIFVPQSKAALAYLDRDVPVVDSMQGGGTGRRLLKPMVLAKLIHAAEIGAGDRMLDVGCATGYSTAVLARLAHTVVALEEDASLARMAAENLRSVGCTNATVVTGPLTEGWNAEAPYDAILVNGSSDIAPAKLLSQLKDGGRLVCVQGRAPASKAMIYRSAGGAVSGRPIFDAVAPLLPGFAEPPAFVF
jgi:protein-L-isoaspartate(D-aspartate) O-methyltransferase